MPAATPNGSTLTEELLQHEDFVRHLARRLVRDGAEADDLAQDAFVLALERPPRERAGLRAWLAGTVRRLAHHRGRAEARRRRREAAAARPEARSLAEPLEEQQRVVAAVLALEEPFREVVLLTHYHGLSPAEIAARVHVPAATVRTRLHRAHAKLRGRLDEVHGGDRRAWLAALAPFVARDGGKAPASPAPVATLAARAAHVPHLPAMALGAALVVAAGLTWWLAFPAPEPPRVASSARPSPAETGTARALAAVEGTGVVDQERTKTTRRLLPQEVTGLEARRLAYWDAVREARSTMVRFADAWPEIKRDVALREAVERMQVRGWTVSAERDLRLVVDSLSIITNVPITITPAALASTRERDLVIDFAFHESHSLAAMLDLLAFLAHDDIQWVVVDGEVRVGTPAELAQHHILFAHSVADFLLEPRDFFASKDDIHPIFEPSLGIRDLAYFVEENVAVWGWEDEGVSLEVGEGVLMIRHAREVHVEIEALLDRLRRFQLPLPEEGSPGEKSTLDSSSAKRRVSKWLTATPVDSLCATEAGEIPLADLLPLAASSGGFDFVVIQNVAAAIPEDEANLAAAFDALLAGGVAWTLCHGVVVLWPGYTHGGRRATVLRDVRDILTGVAIPADRLTGHPALLRRIAVDDSPFVLAEDHLDWLLRDHVHPASWDHDPANMLRIADGVLTLSQSPGVIAEVDSLLDVLRRIER